MGRHRSRISWIISWSIVLMNSNSNGRERKDLRCDRSLGYRWFSLGVVGRYCGQFLGVWFLSGFVDVGRSWLVGSGGSEMWLDSFRCRTWWFFGICTCIGRRMECRRLLYVWYMRVCIGSKVGVCGGVRSIVYSGVAVIIRALYVWRSEYRSGYGCRREGVRWGYMYRWCVMGIISFCRRA